MQPGIPTLELRALPTRPAVPPDGVQRGAGRRAICVTHVLPYPARAGNAVRIHRLLRWLADEGWNLLVVLCPSTAPTEEQLQAAADAYPNVVICTHGGTVWHRMDDGGAALDALRGRQAADVASLLGETASRAVDLQRSFCPDVLVRLLWHLDRTWRPDVLFAEYVFMTRPFPLLRGDLVKVVDTLDVFSTKAGKVERHGVSDGFAISEADEAHLLRGADVVIGIQPLETELLCRLATDSVVVTAGIDVPVEQHAPGVPEGRRVLLVGDDNPMNVRGLEDFLCRAWPLVRAAVPDAELRIAGAVGLAVANSADGVRALGHVDHLGAEYAACRLTINPVIAGTGLKVKTVEALAHWRPVVTWPAGAEGLGPAGQRHCEVASSWPDFAERVVRLLGDRQVSDAARTQDTALAQELSSEEVYAPLRGVLHAATARRSRRERTTPAVTSRPLRIVTLLAQHGTARYPTALADLQQMFARQLPGASHDVLVIDNALPPGRHGDGAVEVIGGPNESWEFSAWDEGIAHLGARLDDYDFVHLATSAFRQLYVRYLDRFDEPMLRLVQGRAAVVGHIDRHLRPVTVLGLGAHAWVRSSFMLLPPLELRRLGSLVGVTDRTRIFSGDARAPFRDDAPLSTTCQRFILDWLTGGGTGQGTSWHSRFALGPDTLRRFEDKATAVLNEQLLSLRLRAGGCDLVDATWLATTAQLCTPPFHRFPSWPEQLAARDTDAVADTGG